VSKERNNVSLHLEWAPGRVVARDAATGRSAAAASLAELGSITGAHKEAIVGISRNHVFLKVVPLPKAAPEDLRQILAIQIGQLFPLPADQLAFDFIQTNEHADDGWLTMIAAIRAEDLRQLRADLQKAGLRPARILPVALGSAAVATHAGNRSALVVEETPAGYTLDVVKSGVVRLSRTAPPLSDLAREAQRTLAAAGAGDLPLVTVGDLPLHPAQQASAGALNLLNEAPPFLFEMDEERTRAIQKRIATKTRLAGLMMLSALLLVTLVWVDRSDQQAKLTRGQGAWARQLGKLRSTLSYEQSKAERAVQVDTGLKSAYNVAQPLGDIAAAAGDSLPTSAWLSGLSIERGKPVQIRGTAANPDDVAHFLERLAATSRFRDIKLTVANTARIDQTTVVQFNVNAVAIGNLPMPSPEKLGSHRTAKPAAGGAAGATTAAAAGSGSETAS